MSSTSTVNTIGTNRQRSPQHNTPCSVSALMSEALLLKKTAGKISRSMNIIQAKKGIDIVHQEISIIESNLKARSTKKISKHKMEKQRMLLTRDLWNPCVMKMILGRARGVMINVQHRSNKLILIHKRTNERTRLSVTAKLASRVLQDWAADTKG